jgi:uncharacterized damage-inducible protein DinB
MAENNAWSNLRLLRACGGLTEADYLAPRTSFFPSIHLTLQHILLVDLYYLDGLTKGGLGRRVWAEADACDTFAKVRVAQREADGRLVAFTAGLVAEADLEATVELERADHVQRERAIDVLLHLFQHQIHHRGQVHAMLAGTSVKPPQLDDFFLAGDAPLRAAELAELGLPVR